MDLRPRNRPVPLRLLAELIEGSLDGANAPGGIDVSGVAVSSQAVRAGDLFVGLPGARSHGAAFCRQASDAGAVAALTDSAGLPAARAAGLPTIVVANPRTHVGVVAAEVYEHPADRLLTFAVTGTNGKTTTTWLLEAGLRAAGHVTGLVGTVETQIAGRQIPSVRTTPEAADLQALLAVMVESGVTAVALEVSSHALQLGRVDGMTFDVAGFTQFGSDHLDFHASAEEYFAAKARLFARDHARHAVICVDDKGGRRMVEVAEIPCQSLSTTNQPADWVATDIASVPSGGHTFALTDPQGVRRPGGVRLPGRFNVANASLAIAMLATAGVADSAVRGVQDCPGVPGRMQLVSAGQGFLAVVDYAHTPDALQSVLSSLADQTRDGGRGRLIVVFGCGGDRDLGKRPAMGSVAVRLADVVIVTDDNPRSEEPSRIRQEILVGARSVPESERAAIHEVGDRGRAIAFAVDMARPGDVLVVAGKGHETGQEIAGSHEPFDDREVLLARLQDRSTEDGQRTTRGEKR